MKITADEVDVIGTLLNNGAPVGGGSAALNVSGTADVLLTAQTTDDTTNVELTPAIQTEDNHEYMLKFFLTGSTDDFVTNAFYAEGFLIVNRTTGAASVILQKGETQRAWDVTSGWPGPTYGVDIADGHIKLMTTGIAATTVKWAAKVQLITLPVANVSFVDVPMTIDGAKRVAEFPLLANEHATLEVRWTARVTDGTDQDVYSGVTVLQAADKAGTMAVNYQEVKNGVTTTGGFVGQQTVDFEKDEANDKVYLRITHSSNSLTPTSGLATLEVTRNWQNKVLTAL